MSVGILWLADMHSGSPYSLFGGETQLLMNGPRGPSARQLEIYKHWREVLDTVAEWRKGFDRLVCINAGDAVEGLHHQNKDIISPYLTDHQRIHEKLMNECKSIVHYDTLYYVNGTLDHAGEEEFDIATVLGAERYEAQNFTHPVLKKKVCGKLIYVAHHGPGPGRGINAGNMLRNKVKQLDYDLRRENQQSPDMVVFAHQHQHQRERVYFDDHFTDGFILPSWKLLDSYINRVNPFAWSNIGAMISECSEAGIYSRFLTVHIEQNPVGNL